MFEDKLTHEERLRLECLSQAQMTIGIHPAPTTQVIDRAALFEEYVKNGTNPKSKEDVKKGINPNGQ